MNILIVNDDGIYAEGLMHVVQWAKEFADVTVVAPKVQQSGKSHAIEIHDGYEVTQVDLIDGVKAYSVDSTPADCTRIALLALKLKPDLVISGINRGFNIGGDIVYSGTVGAVFEAARLGCKGLALSADLNGFDSAKKYLNMTFQYIIENKMFNAADILNVNFPDTVKGFRITHQGAPIYEDDFEPCGENGFRPVLQCVYTPSPDLSNDCDAVMNGYISISPLTVDRTDKTAYEILSKRVSG